LLERHLETLGTEARGGRAELAPELMSLATSWVQWFRALEAEEEIASETKKVKFAKKVLFRAIEHRNKGRSCRDRSVGRAGTEAWTEAWNASKARGLTKFAWDKVEKTKWSDMVDTLEEQGGERKKTGSKEKEHRSEPRGIPTKARLASTTGSNAALRTT
jgi:hypothetical protein